MSNTSSRAALILILFAAGAATSGCGGGHQTAPTTPLPFPGGATVVHGVVHQANGGPLSGVWIDLGDGTQQVLTDESGSYRFDVPQSPVTGRLPVSFSKPGYVWRREEVGLMPHDTVANFSLAPYRHLRAGSTLTFPLSDDDPPMMRANTYDEFICKPCAEIVMDAMPASGLTIHVTWTRAVPITVFVEGSDDTGEMFQVSELPAPGGATEMTVTIAADWSVRSAYPPTVKIGRPYQSGTIGDPLTVGLTAAAGG